jgi:heme/copper-type cytochrome/quinol oxidase subunit 3
MRAVSAVAFAAFLASKIAEMALRLVLASRSIWSRTNCARCRTDGSDLLLLIHASRAKRFSSVTVRSLSWAMMSSYARTSSRMRTARVLTPSFGDDWVGMSAHSWLDLLGVVRPANPGWVLQRKPQVTKRGPRN